MKPFIERRTAVMANSVVIAALAPLESESCLPARIARNGIACATTMPMALSICSGVAPIIAPNVAALAIAPWTTWSTLYVLRLNTSASRPRISSLSTMPLSAYAPSLPTI